MTPEEFHREKLKEVGYKDEAIEEFVFKFIKNINYEFAEKYHQNQLKLLNMPNHIDDSFDWDKFAEKLNNEHGSSHLINDGDENNPYNYWLMDVTVKDIIDFIKNYS